MKVIIIFIIVLLQTYIIMPTNETEEQENSLVRKYKPWRFCQRKQPWHERQFCKIFVWHTICAI